MRSLLCSTRRSILSNAMDRLQQKGRKCLNVHTVCTNFGLIVHTPVYKIKIRKCMCTFCLCSLLYIQSVKSCHGCCSKTALKCSAAMHSAAIQGVRKSAATMLWEIPSLTNQLLLVSDPKKRGKVPPKGVIQKTKTGKIASKNRNALGPPPPVVSFFATPKITPIFFVGKCIYNGQNKFYAWSHVKIFLFSSIIMVQFYHELTILHGRGWTNSCNFGRIYRYFLSQRETNIAVVSLIWNRDDLITTFKDF